MEKSIIQIKRIILALICLPLSLSSIKAQNTLAGEILPLGNEGLFLPNTGFAINSQGELFIGGCEQLHKWDGSQWNAFQAVFNGQINLLAFDASDNLYVSGSFDTVAGQPAQNIAKWNGSSWSSLGNGLNLPAMFMDFDDQGNLYTATDRETVVRKWNGTSWDTVGGDIGINVTALYVEASGNVYTGNSDLQGAGSLNIMNHWDGTSWDTVMVLSSFSSGRAVYAIGQDAQGNIYAGGEFESVNGQEVNHIAKWDGSTISDLDTGVDGDRVFALWIDAQDNVRIGGKFDLAGNTMASNIAIWDGSDWSNLGSGTDGQIRQLAYAPNGPLYALGSFDSAGSVLSPRIATWDGTSWERLGEKGVITNINRFSRVVTDEQGSLYVSNLGSSLSGSLSFLTKWDGNSWTDLFSSIALRDGSISPLAFDSEGNLYLGGTELNATNPNANFRDTYVIVWDGNSWTNFGDSLDGDAVSNIVIDSADNVYITADSDLGDPGTVMRWESEWVALDSFEFNNTVFGASTLALLNGDLFGAFEFLAPGNTGGYTVARWNGQLWDTLGGAFDNVISSLAEGPDGSVYAGGFFNSIDGLGVEKVAKWNGSAWESVGMGFGGASAAVSNLTFDEQGLLYASGQGFEINGQEIGSLAIWDGNNWLAPSTGFGLDCDPFGSGIFSATARAEGGIYVSGFFDAPYLAIAAWIPDSMGTTSRAPAVELSEIILYPNPATSRFRIRSPKTVIQSISLYDLRGRILPAEINYVQNEVEVYSRYDGLVMVKIQTEHGVWVQKVKLEAE